MLDGNVALRARGEAIQTLSVQWMTVSATGSTARSSSRSGFELPWKKGKKP